jgi:hypothetical protein
MSSAEKLRTKGVYYSVIEGTLRTRVDKDHPEAVAREYETRDGATAIKHELVFKALKGFITNIEFHDGDYGRTVNITLDENEEGATPVIQLNVETTYGEDFLKKLPNVDLEKEVRIAPFAFTAKDNGREMRGISLLQKDAEGKWKVKAENYFYDREKKTVQNGYPTPEGDTKEYGKDDWKIYFLQARKFLIAYAVREVLPKLEGLQVKRDTAPETASADDVEINPDDIPW